MLRYDKIPSYLNLNRRIWPYHMNSIVKINKKTKIWSYLHLILSYLFIQNHFKITKKSTNFDNFRIQNVSTKILLVRNSQDLSSAINMSLWACLVTFKTQKRRFLMIFLDFCLFLSFFPKSVMIFVSQHGNMHPGRCFRDLVQPGWVVTPPTGP